MWNTGHLIIVAVISLPIGGMLGFLFARWWFTRQFKEIEKKYQESVKKTYREMGSFFGRKMSEEDLNKITTQIEGKNEERKPNPKKSKPKRKK